jgi:hypothetical protein
VYCFFLLIHTFIFSFLLAYVLEPVSGAFAATSRGLAVGIVSVLTSAPLVSILAFVLLKLLAGLFHGVIACATLFARLVHQSLTNPEGGGDLRSLSRDDARCDPSLILVIALLSVISAIAGGLVFMTFFVPYLAIAIGCLAGFGCLVTCILNYGSPFVGWCELLFPCFRCSRSNLTQESWLDSRFNDILKWAITKTFLANAFSASVDPEGRTLTIKLVLGLDFVWFQNFANHIRAGSDHFRDGRPPLKSRRWRPLAQTILAWLFTLMHVYVIAESILLCAEDPSPSFIATLVLRILLVPQLAFFHPFVGFFFRALDPIMRWCFRLGTIFAGILLIIAVPVLLLVAPSYINPVRFDSLPPLPPNWSNIPAFPSVASVCNSRAEGLSILDALGLAFGGYEVQRDSSAFLRELNYFFGPNSSQSIGYETDQLAPDIPMLVYNISGVTVFAFRGFATIPELGIQIEMLARYRVLPFAYAIMPGYDAIAKHYLRWFTPGLHSLASLWFTPRSIYAQFLDQAMKSYNARDLTVDSPVVFVGINMGGVLAKDLAMRTGHPGIAFLSMPVSTEFFTINTEENLRSAMQVTNIFNLEGLFGVEDPKAATNAGVPGSPNLLEWDSAYASFCNLVENCGYHDQFVEYCTTAIGADALAEIRTYLRLA